MPWDVAKSGLGIESSSFSHPRFKQRAARQGVGGEASNLGAEGRKARAKEMKKSKLAEGE